MAEKLIYERLQLVRDFPYFLKIFSSHFPRRHRSSTHSERSSATELRVGIIFPAKLLTEERADSSTHTSNRALSVLSHDPGVHSGRLEDENLAPSVLLFFTFIGNLKTVYKLWKMNFKHH